MSIPGTMAVMEKWFRTDKRGFVMGFWAGNSNIGNIVGYELGTSITDGLGCEWVYFHKKIYRNTRCMSHHVSYFLWDLLS